MGLKVDLQRSSPSDRKSDGEKECIKNHDQQDVELMTGNGTFGDDDKSKC